MKWLLAAAAIAVGSLDLTVPTTPARHPDYGVVTSIQFLQGPSFQRLQELGAGSVRIGIDWDVVEPLPGRFDLAPPLVDVWLNTAHNAGLHIYASLGSPPSWAAPCSSCLPYNL